MNKTTNSTLRPRSGFVCFLLSAMLWVATTVCFIGTWDSVAAITLFPHWAWAVSGGFLGFAAWRLCGKRRILVLPLLWMATTFCFADNVLPMLRLLRSDPSPVMDRPPKGLRVVTLNCAGNPAAAAELAALKPDVVLLQEIPATNHLARLTREWFGETGTFVAGLDCAILARSRLEQTGNHRAIQHVHGVVHFPEGHRLSVTSLRLVPPETRLDLWNPKAWRAHADNRRLRRRQLQTALERDSATVDLAEIVGGDFNAPVPDAVFRLLSRFQDGYLEAGRGWGHTALNDFPVVRPDQIWFKGLAAISVRAIRTRNSDHRMVVADFQLRH